MGGKLKTTPRKGKAMAQPYKREFEELLQDIANWRNDFGEKELDAIETAKQGKTTNQVLITKLAGLLDKFATPKGNS